MKPPLRTILFWHMHQPSYLDPESRNSLMPWVRLHAIKDYYDMAKIIEDVQGAKAVINFVPSLWEQLESIGRGEELDKHEIICRKHVSDLNDEEKMFVVENFFSCQVGMMIKPYKPYKDLFFRFGPDGDSKLILQAEDQTICDLQVWYHLAWSGHTLRSRPFVDQLLNKGSGFTHEEKIRLLDVQRELVAEIPAYYKKLVEKGKIEVSSTPYYHPILPLLLEPQSALVACPGMKLPQNSFPLAEDAEQHLLKAIENHQGIFGKKPVGFWPAEGSVSSKAAELFAKNGVNWIATDEEVLRLSLKKERLTASEKFRLYEHKGVNIFFRDHSLSDQIGFVYQNYKASEAVKEFVGHLHSIHAALPEFGDFVVPVILDGENCWEFYEEQGRPFLTELYSTLVRDPLISLCTCEDVVTNDENGKHLDYLHSGSWIDANFTTWVGDPVKNRGWEFLYKARKAVEQALQNGNLDQLTKTELMEEVYAAEGSDWFWWFGEGHSSDHDSMFDLLFRKRLMHIYRLIGLNIPSYLMEPVDDRAARVRYTLPTEFISPEINGRSLSYSEWMSSGECLATGGSMQKSTVLMEELRYGFDKEYLYLRLKGIVFGDRRRLRNKEILISLRSPLKKNIRIQPGADLVAHVEQADNDTKTVQNVNDNGIVAAMGEYLEVALPLGLLGAGFGKWKTGEKIRFNVTLVSSGRDIEKLPEEGHITFDCPDNRFVGENWFI